MEALRHNKGKLRLDLISAFSEEQLAKVLTVGVEKYAERNWEKGMKWSKVISSLKRHLNAIEQNEDFDKEDGLLHISHLLCNAMFLCHYYKFAPQYDDRVKIPLLRIGLDVDGVIADFATGFSNYYKYDYPTNWSFGSKTKELYDSIKDNSSFYNNLQPLISPNELLFEPLVYISTREISEDVTIKWIDDNKLPFAKVVHVRDFKDKLIILQQLNINIFIEDNIDTFYYLNNNGILCYLIDRPYNSKYNVGFKRISNLNDIITGNNLKNEISINKV